MQGAMIGLRNSAIGVEIRANTSVEGLYTASYSNAHLHEPTVEAHRRGSWERAAPVCHWTRRGEPGHFAAEGLCHLRGGQRGEFFNMLNCPNFGLPNRTRGDATFGSIGSASGGRQIQPGIRLVF